MFHSLRSSPAPLELECLENREVPSTVSSVTANFNGTAIPAGDTLWFTAAVTVTGLPKTAPATVHVENGAIDFTAGGTPYHVAVPNGVLVFTPAQTSASASFDPTDTDWDVGVPSSGTGDVFATGVSLPLPNGLPGGVKNVAWTADFWSDTAGVGVNWKWAAAAYKPGFGTDYNALNVKPADAKNLGANNADQSGTPEAFKSLVTAGGTGGGGTNYTGNYSKSAGVKPTLGDGMQDYPYPSSNPLTSIAFNESTVLRAANLDTTNGYFELWYNDEHALSLGVRQVNVISANGTTTTTNYPVTPLTANPGVATNPQLGTTAGSGDQAGTDLSGRPMSPMLYITDTTNNPNDRSGDWQWGGTGYAPNALFGTWKGVVRTVDNRTTAPTVTVTCDADPIKNNWNLGAGSDAPPAGLANEGYGAEVRWNLADLSAAGVLVPGHTYRFYVMVHDGDQNKSGGDSGQASFNYTIPAPANQPAAVSGHVYGGIFGTTPLPYVTLTLTGFDSQNNPVNLTATTDIYGFYSFGSLQPGTYTITQTLPNGYDFSTPSVGTVGGTSDGTVLTNAIGGIYLAPGDTGVNYDFVDGVFG